MLIRADNVWSLINRSELLLHQCYFTLGIMSLAPRLLLDVQAPEEDDLQGEEGCSCAAVHSQSQQEGPPGVHRSEEGAGSGKKKMEHGSRPGWHIRGAVATVSHLLRDSLSSRYLSFYWFRQHLDFRSENTFSIFCHVQYFKAVYCSK